MKRTYAYLYTLLRNAGLDHDEADTIAREQSPPPVWPWQVPQLPAHTSNGTGVA